MHVTTVSYSNNSLINTCHHQSKLKACKEIKPKSL